MRESSALHGLGGQVLLYSRAAQYAVQAVLLLAIQPEGKLLRIKEIGKELDIPGPFLAQIFHKLAKYGILYSMKGPTGGFRLARPADEISVNDIVEGVDGKVNTQECVMGLKECTSDAPCPFHERWAIIRDEFYALLLNEKLSDLTDAFRTKLEVGAKH
jgi:Rrf2 family protein